MCRQAICYIICIHSSLYVPLLWTVIGLFICPKQLCFNAVFRLFKDGQINWGRIVTLLCFGYRLTVTVIQQGISGFFSKIVTFILDFLISNKITEWIARHGGWVIMLLLQTHVLLSRISQHLSSLVTLQILPNFLF